MGFGKFGNSSSFHLFTEKAVKTVKRYSYINKLKIKCAMNPDCFWKSLSVL